MRPLFFLFIIPILLLNGCVTRSNKTHIISDLDAPLKQIKYVEPDFPAPFPLILALNHNGKATTLIDYEATDNRIKFIPVAPVPRKTEPESEVARVFVDFTITETGEVSDVKIVDPIDSSYETAAVKAIYQWRYLPPLKHGRPVAIKVRQQINFAYPL